MTEVYTIQKVINGLLPSLREPARDIMEFVVRASYHEDYRNLTIPMAYRILDNYDTSLTPEVFLLSLQAHANLYHESISQIIVAQDEEAEILKWLAVHYVMLNPDTLTKVS